MWDAVQCLDDCELTEFLSRVHPSNVDRDTLVRAYSLVDHCPEWEEPSGLDTSPTIDGKPSELAMSVAFALHLAVAERHAAACLVFQHQPRRGFLPVQGGPGEAAVYFFDRAALIPPFWRSVYAFENVPERDFFTVAVEAFPNLVMHESLSFGRFEGAYRDVRDRVVQILGTLCDEFAPAYKQCKGITHDVQAALGSHGLDVSPESPRTRSSAALMGLRDVSHVGALYRCEWHAKIEPHRNRIHFAGPVEALDGKILIGVFAKHLDTGGR
jgi:hypothetical protein